MPACCTRVVPAHALAELHNGVLDVPRMTIVVEVFAHLFGSERAAKPGAPPKHERHEYHEPRRHEKYKPVTLGHAGTRRLRNAVTNVSGLVRRHERDGSYSHG